MNVFSHAAGVLDSEPRWLQVGPSDAPGFLEIPPYQSAEYRLVI